MSALARRWLTRRARAPRALRATVALLMGTAALLILASPRSPQASGAATPPAATGSGGAAAPAQAPQPPGTGRSKFPEAPAPGERTVATPSSPTLLAEGRSLYEEGCSSCHGMDLKGRTRMAPSLVGVGAGPVDFYLSTGRMPLENPHAEPLRTTPLYSRARIQALVAFVSSFGGPPAPTTDPGAGDLALGLHDFTLDCAGCHQIVGRGGLTIGAIVPELQSATAQQVAEAVRMGPYVMPRFGPRQIDQHALDSIARYVLWTRAPSDRGGWGISNIGPIPEGMVAWFLALTALVIVARLIGERTN
ncbi:MAG: c-type cytochrome [Solirubrobacterales bacterium]|nr:c-type cytochrome [Solirubrobacterales bacterium]MCW3025927.1 c-type cytochrome [Solirubrobacterales bacterium]